MTNPAPRTNEDRAALDAQVLELLASTRIATVDGDGNMGPKALAFALDLSVAAVRASLLRLRAAGRITAEPPHATASVLFYEVRAAERAVSKVRPGLYEVVLDVDGAPATFTVERFEAGDTAYRGDVGMWAVHAPGNVGEPHFATMRDALATLVPALWFRHPQYGVCARPEARS